jgi:hypothetical protein
LRIRKPLIVVNEYFPYEKAQNQDKVSYVWSRGLGEEHPTSPTQRGYLRNGMSEESWERIW